MGYTYSYLKSINDTYYLQYFLYQNGYTNINGISTDGSGITYIDFSVQLTTEQESELSNLINNVYTNPLPQNSGNNLISLYNSSNQVLSSGSVFNGEFEEVINYSCISIIINSDALSLINGIEVHFSTDGIDTDYIKKYSYLTINNNFVELFGVFARYFKIVYKNSNMNQTKFSLQCIYSSNQIPLGRNTTQLNTVEISEESGGKKTKGRFRSQGFSITAEPNQDTIHDFTFPYDIAPLVIKFATSEQHRSDIINLQIAPQATIGALIQPASIGNNFFYVNTTALNWLNVGYICYITNGVTTDELGDVVDIDYVSNKVILENSFVNNYAPGSFVKITVNPIRNLIISEPQIHNIGDSKIGATFIPKNNIVRLVYTNNSNESKIFSWQCEMLY